MTQLLKTGLKPIKNRDPKFLEMDKMVVRAIAQAAIEVELFTIPLYMVSLYSIQGTHQINAKNFDYYQGRLWPGSATTANPRSANEKAFNLVFSVFIDEMLHLQMAANIAHAIGVQPCFTSSALQNKDHGWNCYGDDKNVIPHILDLRDTKNSQNVKVKLDSLNEAHLQLFLAIEEPLNDAYENIFPDKLHKYFPEVPFKSWNLEQGLPMFGNIGWLYECYACYLSIEYSNNRTLWDELYDPKCGFQQDMFNFQTKGEGHPKKEFPMFDPALQEQVCEDPFNAVIDMMSAITDQGEGSTIDNSFRLSRWKKNQPAPIEEVLDKYRPSLDALETDYPSYTDTGKPAKPSEDATARFSWGKYSHYERFEQLKGLLCCEDFVTWDTWHGHPENVWTREMLITSDYNPDTANKKIPKPEEVAGALNRLKNPDNYQCLSTMAVGAIAGITTILDKYWKCPTQDFPYPSMVGSGDRVSIAWAIFGKAPDLSIGIGDPEPGKLYHACQGLSLDGEHDILCNDNDMPAPEIFHSCRGSNICKAQGGCGFAQLERGGGSCSATRVSKPTVLTGREILCGKPPTDNRYSAPSDNKCGGLGGCAVPISASQLYPDYGPPQIMNLYDFVGDSHTPSASGSMFFTKGESVYDKAWEAYSKVIQRRGQNPGPKPQPSDLRIALPPST